MRLTERCVTATTLPTVIVMMLMTIMIGTQVCASRPERLHQDADGRRESRRLRADRHKGA